MRTNLLCLLSVVVLAGACRSGENPPYDLSPGDGSVNQDMHAPDLATADLATADLATSDAGALDMPLALDMSTFTPATNYPVGTGPIYLAVSDLNNDGTPDLVVVNVNDPANAKPSSMSVLLGKGDGTFNAALTNVISDYPFAVSIASFKAAGKKDVVVSTYDGFDYLAGNGDGTFAARQHTVVGTSAFDRGGAIGDIDGDGKLDFVIGDQGDLTANGVIWVVPGKGDGTFRAPVSFTVSTQGNVNAVREPNVVRLAMMDTDAKLDVVVGNSNADGTSSLSILVNQSTPGVFAFSAPTEISSAKIPIDLVLAQADGAHKTDILSVNLGADTVSVYLSNTDDNTLGFASPVQYPAGSGPTAIAIGDIDGDTKADLVVANTTNQVTVLYGDGLGKFGISNASRPGTVSFGVGSDPISVVVATFNNDTKLDVATANQLSNDVSILLNTH